MEKRLKVLFDAEIVDDRMDFEFLSGSGQMLYSHQACGDGGCGRYIRRNKKLDVDILNQQQ